MKSLWTPHQKESHTPHPQCVIIQECHKSQLKNTKVAALWEAMWATGMFQSVAGQDITTSEALTNNSKPEGGGNYSFVPLEFLQMG